MNLIQDNTKTHFRKPETLKKYEGYLYEHFLDYLPPENEFLYSDLDYLGQAVYNWQTNREIYVLQWLKSLQGQGKIFFEIYEDGSVWVKLNIKLELVK